jgi:hypothetical protein
LVIGGWMLGALWHSCQWALDTCFAHVPNFIILVTFACSMGIGHIFASFWNTLDSGCMVKFLGFILFVGHFPIVQLQGDCTIWQSL